jgi:hypothetical protein
VRAIDTLQALRVVARAETEAAAKAILTEPEDAATPAAAGASDLSTYTAEVERHIVKLRTLSCDGGSELPDVVATVVHERGAISKNWTNTPGVPSLLAGYTTRTGTCHGQRFIPLPGAPLRVRRPGPALGRETLFSG